MQEIGEEAGVEDQHEQRGGHDAPGAAVAPPKDRAVERGRPHAARSRVSAPIAAATMASSDAAAWSKTTRTRPSASTMTRSQSSTSSGVSELTRIVLVPAAASRRSI